MRSGRPKKVRYIQKMPKVYQFSPRGKPGRPEEIELKIDEFEAVKLADFQGYDQTEGAKVMGISRPSFGRILRGGRKILAEALVFGKIIRIRTADVQVGVRQKDLPSKREILFFRKQEEVLREKIFQYPEVKDIKESHLGGS